MLTSHPIDPEDLGEGLTPGTQEGRVAPEPAWPVEEGRVGGRVGPGKARTQGLPGEGSLGYARGTECQA